MPELPLQETLLIALIFAWSGFVRSGLGFGGAVLSLPFLLLVDDRPLFYLPIIAVHLLFFSSLIFIKTYRQNQALRTQGKTVDSSIDWPYLKRSLKIMIIPKLIGVLGLITLPAEVMTVIIFGIVTVYSLSYILNRPFQSQRPWLDTLFLILGAYISGTSLIGAPLLTAVFSTHVSKRQLRDTLFALWFILVMIKMGAFLAAGVDLQLEQHLWLLPSAFAGHLLGQRLHDFLQSTDPVIFYRILGSVLLITSLIGIGKMLMA